MECQAKGCHNEVLSPEEEGEFHNPVILCYDCLKKLK